MEHFRKEQFHRGLFLTTGIPAKISGLVFFRKAICRSCFHWFRRVPNICDWFARQLSIHQRFAQPQIWDTFSRQGSYRLKKNDLTGNFMDHHKLVHRFMRGILISFHSGVFVAGHFSGLAAGEYLPPPHSTFASLRRLRFSPTAKPRNDKATSSISLHENRIPLNIYIKRNIVSSILRNIDKTEPDGKIF